MTREKFLHEVIIRLSNPEYIYVFAKMYSSGWAYPYDPLVVIDVIVSVTSNIQEHEGGMYKIIQNRNKLPLDAIVLYFYEKSYKSVIENRFDL